MIRTLADVLLNSGLPKDRGFRFITDRNEEHFYPFSALVEEARKRGAIMSTLDYPKGSRIGLVIADLEHFVLTFLGATLAGFVPVPMYPRSNFSLKGKNSYLDTLRHVVDASGARIVLTMQSTETSMREALSGLRGFGETIAVEPFFDQAPSNIDFSSVSEDDLCFLQFTSGSTSKPKGVMVSHGNLVANARAFLGPRGLDRRDDDIALTWLPLYHDMGLIGFVLGTLICDLQSVLIPTEAFARRPWSWMDAITRYGGTITFAPNFAYALAARRTQRKHLEGLDLTKLRIAGCGSEPISPDVMRLFCERFRPVGFQEKAILPCYGMAEATLAISFHDYDAPMVTDRVDSNLLGRRKAVPAGLSSSDSTVELVGCGHPFPEHEIKIIDKAGRILEDRLVGEVAVRGPSVTKGYFENPQETAATYRDDWLHTGDLGYIAEGQLFLCGRIKDLIIVHGANYYPHDIEWAVAEVPGVVRNAVVALSTLIDGKETLVICVEAKPDDIEALKSAIKARVLEKIGLKIGHVALVKPKTLPKTSSGKIQRSKTKSLFNRGELEEYPNPGDAAFSSF